MKLLPCKNILQHSLEVEDMEQELVNDFIYLVLKINAISNTHNKIHVEIYTRMKCFFALKTIFKFQLVLIISKLTHNWVIICHIVQYFCEIYTTTEVDENSLTIIKIIIIPNYFILRKTRIMEKINKELIKNYEIWWKILTQFLQ